MRSASVVPLGLSHFATEDVEFHGFTIPKGTSLVSNLYSTHHDPEVWGDPENFRPERFLSKDGKTVVKHESLIPFSIGKRVCIGEILARDQLFLFIATLTQQFSIFAEAGKPAPTLETKIGVTLQPLKYSLVMKERIWTILLHSASIFEQRERGIDG